MGHQSVLLAFHDRSVFLIKRKMSAYRSGRFEEQPLDLGRIKAGSPLLDLTLILLVPMRQILVKNVVLLLLTSYSA